MKVAVVGKVVEVASIEGADRIASVTVVCGNAGRWMGVAGKDLAVGDTVNVFLQDALFPKDERWAFMESRKWRVSMARFKGVPSECLILPKMVDGKPGDDISEALGVTKYVKTLPESLAGDAVGVFPSFLPKTDEPNFQTVDWQALLETGDWYVTEKADGSSCTAWVEDGQLHVASRNLELREFNAAGKSNAYWSAARRYGLEGLEDGTAVQFEVIGPSIQSNPMGVTNIEGRLFGAFKKTNEGRWVRQGYDEIRSIGFSFMPLAKEIPVDTKQQWTADKLRELAAIKYDNGKHGEGVVIRAFDQSFSFKVINLNYKG